MCDEREGIVKCRLTAEAIADFQKASGVDYSDEQVFGVCSVCFADSENSEQRWFVQIIEAPNVVALVPAMEPDEHVVSMLEDLLKDAKDGVLQEFYLIGIRTNDEVVRALSHGIYDHPIKVCGWLEYDKLRFLLRLAVENGEVE